MKLLKILLLKKVGVDLLVRLLHQQVILSHFFQVFLAFSLGLEDSILSVFLAPLLSILLYFQHLILTFLDSLLVSQLNGLVNLLSVCLCIVFRVGLVERVNLCIPTFGFFVLRNSLV